MTRQEAAKMMDDLFCRKQRALEGLLEPARAAVHALKDAKLENSARRLDEALYEVQLADDERDLLVKQNAQLIIDVLLERFGE